jgi:peptide deformylase
LNTENHDGNSGNYHAGEPHPPQKGAQNQQLGLAAPQVNVSQRLIVVRLPDDEESVAEYGDEAGVLYMVANPEIARASEDMVEGVEACLSLPGVFGNVLRHEAVTVKGQDRNGKALRIKAEGWLARVFQHEIDHLDGILFIERTDEIWRASERPPIDEGDTPPEHDAASEETP